MHLLPQNAVLAKSVGFAVEASFASSRPVSGVRVHDVRVLPKNPRLNSLTPSGCFQRYRRFSGRSRGWHTTCSIVAKINNANEKMQHTAFSGATRWHGASAEGACPILANYKRNPLIWLVCTSGRVFSCVSAVRIAMRKWKSTTLRPRAPHVPNPLWMCAQQLNR